ncbi:hypothetical protein HUT06_35395 [Actinomadura sp. NAK00032]|uniref:hypothetical protein n=1 Tax=Actinomadura sp. NAK00032 TaxID=2742128 RepID=UPI0015911D60|nr:hypothetical protein [Actinomadura sp. NAK00032]QKW38653.1 hypothetical protein HUT06_35395 [Actinomadura sp. NAK00032]
MDLRLPAALTTALADAAGAEGIPVEEAAARAVTEWLERHEAHRARVGELIQEVMAEDARLLARLGDA